MYKIFYDDSGNIWEYTKVMSHENNQLNSAIVPDDLSSIFDDITIGKYSVKKFKVDIDSKEFLLIDLYPSVKDEDIFLNKLVEINYNQNNTDLAITIKTINYKPHILIEGKHDQDRKFDIMMTRKKNINFLYQNFECETNKSNVFEVDQIDYRDIFSGNFSLYYKKIYSSAGYTIL